VEEDVARIGCRNCKVATLNREGRRRLLKEAKTHPGLYRHWREKIKCTIYTFKKHIDIRAVQRSRVRFSLKTNNKIQHI
jgi:hypothetical protein